LNIKTSQRGTWEKDLTKGMTKSTFK